MNDFLAILLGVGVSFSFAISGWALKQVHNLSIEVAILRERDAFSEKIIEQVKLEISRLEDRLSSRIDNIISRLSSHPNQNVQIRPVSSDADAQIS